MDANEPQDRPNINDEAFRKMLSREKIIVRRQLYGDKSEIVPPFKIVGNI